MMEIILLIGLGYILATVTLAIWVQYYLRHGWAGSAPKTKDALKATLDKSERPY